MVTAFIIRKLPLDKQVEIRWKGNLTEHCSRNGAGWKRRKLAFLAQLAYETKDKATLRWPLESQPESVTTPE